MMARGRMLVLLLALALLLPAVVLAQVGGSYDLSWNTVDGGGGTSSGGDYTLNGTVGQPDAETMSGGEYVLAGGFWGSAGTQYRLYLPVVVR
ncbi:MAG: hypothetical protein D6802_03625 [Ardenticatenia bacterium]|nr:MAG: hypothetical protein D6802_03625 [Ardenticatenia bacterium]